MFHFLSKAFQSHSHLEVHIAGGVQSHYDDVCLKQC